MNLKIVYETDISPALDQAIKKTLCACFPADAEAFGQSRAWHTSRPRYSIIIEQDDLISAHVGVIDRVVRAGQAQVRVAGIQNVCVLPDHRGQGLADQVMKVAMDEALRLSFDFGLLYCVSQLEKVYARMGWRNLSGISITCLDYLTGRETLIPAKNIAMFFSLKRGTFPPGHIHLQGTDW